MLLPQPLAAPVPCALRAPTLPRGAGGRALLTVVTALLLAASARADEGGPEWLGTVTRGQLDAGAVQRARGSLERALLRHGVSVLETSATSADAVRVALAEATQSLDDAREAWRARDATRTIDETRAAVAALSRGPLFTDDAAAWSAYRDALVLQALAHQAAAQPVEALAVLRTLLTAVPLSSPGRDPATQPLATLVDRVRAELAATPHTSIEVRSVPPGATVLIDGRERGLTPLLVEDAIPGPHRIAVVGPAGRYTERVVVQQDGARVVARFGGKNLAAARAALEAVRRPMSPTDFEGTVGRASRDALLAVVTPAGKRLDVVAARVTNGVVRVVCGARVPDSDNERERAMYLLVGALLAGERDAWVEGDADQSAASLRPHLFAGLGDASVPDAAPESERGLSPAAIAVGVIAGVAVVGGVATGLGIYLLREARKDEGFTFTVAAGDL